MSCTTEILHKLRGCCQTSSYVDNCINWALDKDQSPKDTRYGMSTIWALVIWVKDEITTGSGDMAIFIWCRLCTAQRRFFQINGRIVCLPQACPGLCPLKTDWAINNQALCTGRRKWLQIERWSKIFRNRGIIKLELERTRESGCMWVFWAQKLARTLSVRPKSVGNIMMH